MDLIANYGSSSSDEEDHREQQKSPAKPRGSLFASLPAPKQRAAPAFPSLPPPKISSPTQEKAGQEEEEEKEVPNHKSASDNETPKSRMSLFDSLPAPKSHAVASAFPLPPPKNKSAKRVVEFKLPVNRSLLESQEDDEDPAPKKRAVSDGKALAGGLAALLPPPKNSLGLGSGSAGGHIGRRSAIEAGNPSTEIADELSAAVSVDQTVFGSHEATAERAGEADYGVYSSSDGAAWSHGNCYEENHYQNPQNWSHGRSGETAQTGQQPSEGAGSNAAMFEKKRGRNEIPSDIIEVKQDELMSNRPRLDQARLTGIAFGPSYQPVSSVKGKPSKLHKRKHQIGSLYFDLKQREMELAERRAKGQLTKAETQAKYGW